MIGKKTYLVDGESVEVDEKDLSAFIKSYPNAKEAKSFIVDNDTVDVELPHVETFIKSYPNAKPLYEDAVKKKEYPLPSQIGGKVSPSPYAPLSLSQEKEKDKDPLTRLIEEGSKPNVNEQLTIEQSLQEEEAGKMASKKEVARKELSDFYSKNKFKVSGEFEPMVKVKEEAKLASPFQPQESEDDKRYKDATELYSSYLKENKPELYNYYSSSRQNYAEQLDWVKDEKNRASVRKSLDEIDAKFLKEAIDFKNTLLGVRIQEIDKTIDNNVLLKRDSLLNSINAKVPELQKIEEEITAMQQNPKISQLNNKYNEKKSAYDEEVMALEELKKINGDPSEQNRIIESINSKVPELQQLGEELNKMQQDPRLKQLFADYNKKKAEYEEEVGKFDAVNKSVDQDALNEYVDAHKMLDIGVKDAEAYINKFPQLAAEKIKEKSRQNVVDLLFEINPQARAEMSVKNQVGRAVFDFFGSVATAPRVLSFNNEYGWTDEMADASDKAFKAVENTLFPEPTKFKNELFSDGKMNTELLLPKAVRTVSDMGILVGTSLVGGGVLGGSKIALGASTVASSMALTMKQYYDDALDAGMTPKEASFFSTGVSLQQGLLELINPEAFLIRKQLSKKITEGYAKNLLSGVSTKEALKKAGKEYAKNIAGENIQEFSQSYNENLNKKLANLMFDTQFKDTEIGASEAKETFILTTIASLSTGGIGIGGVGRVKSDIEKQSLYYAAKDKDNFIAAAQRGVDKGLYTPKQLEEIKSTLDELKPTIDALPSNVGENIKYDIVSLIYDKSKLKKQIVGVDEMVAAPMMEQIATIDKKIGELLADVMPSYMIGGKSVTKEDFIAQINNPEVIAKVKSGELDVKVKNDNVVSTSLFAKMGEPKPTQQPATLTNEEIDELRGLELDKEESPEDFTKEDEARLNELKQKQATKSKQEQLVGSVGVGGDVNEILDDNDIKKEVASIEKEIENQNLSYYNDTTTLSNVTSIKEKNKIAKLFKPLIDKIKEKVGSNTIKLYRAQEEVLNTNNGQFDGSVLSFTTKKEIAEKWAKEVSNSIGRSKANVIEIEVPFDNIIGVKTGLGQYEFYVKNEGVVKESVEQSLKEQPIEATQAEVIPPTEQTKGNKLFSEPAPDIVNVSESYKKNNKIETPAGEKIYDIDVEEAKKRADAYDEMKHDPNNPEVKASYEAMAKETLEQHKHLMDNGYTIEIYEGEGEPYKNSNEMLKDLRENKHLFVLSTEKDFGQTPITEKQRSENPLLKDSGFKDVNGKPLLVNDVFRFVHDAFGHGERGNSFGAKGEENAWDVHARMFSPLARRAMTTETRGQNSWVNFGKHLRNPDGTIKKVSAKEKPFAEQKIGLLPEWASELPSEKTAPVKEEKRVSQAQAKIIERTKELANNVVKALKSVNPDAKVVMHDTPKSFAKAAEDAGADGQESIGAGGFHNPNTGEIHLNLQHIASNTLFHEGVHPILNAIEAIDPTIIEDLYSQLLEVEKELGVDGKYSEVFARQYAKESQKMEALTEFLADVADGKITINRTNFEKVRDIIVKMLSAVGIDVSEKIKSTDDLIAIAKKISKGFESGRDIKIEKGETGFIDSNGNPLTNEKLQFSIQNDFSDVKSKITFTYLKNSESFEKLKKEEIVTENKKLEDFDGKYIFLHSPDGAFTGMIYKNGELLVEGKGGIFYPIKFHEDGYFWASTKSGAASMVKQLNESARLNGGKAYMALISSPHDKLLSSTTAANGVLDIFSSKVLDKNVKIGENDIKSAIVKAAKSREVVNEKNVGLGLKVDSKESLENIKNIIKEKLSPDNSSFADRKHFVEQVIKNVVDNIRGKKSEQKLAEFLHLGISNTEMKGITKKGYKLSKTNVVSAISHMLQEPLLRNDKKAGSVYAILELDAKSIGGEVVESVESKKHESYPIAIKSKDGVSKTKLHILQDRNAWNENFNDPKTGKTVLKERELNIFPTSGVSTSPLELKVKSEPKPQFQKPKKGVDHIENAGKRKEMTEDDKGNYLFFHYSDTKFNKLNPEKVGKHLATSRGESPRIKTSHLYTRPDRLEPNVPNANGYVVAVPKEKVYHFNTDPLNLLPEAKKRFRKENGKDVAFDLNNQVAYVSKIASEKGFLITTSDWNIKGTKALRAQTTESLPVEKYSGIKEGTYNQIEFNPKYEDVKPNAKRKDIQFQRIISVNGKDINVKKTQIDVVNGFYSPLEKIISESKFDKLPAKQWLDKFVKGDEAKWTGLTEWLSQQQGSVSKADIQKFLKENRVSVVEVVGSEAKGNLPSSQMRGQITSLQLEGEKENYIEVLVTLPKKKAKIDGFEIAESDTVIYEDRGMGKPLKIVKVIPKKFTEASNEVSKYIKDNSYKHEYNLDYNDGESVMDALEKAGVRFDKTEFASSHFDEPNILVHLRMNIRLGTWEVKAGDRFIDKDGNISIAKENTTQSGKVLFLEEIQSDWGQRIKKVGVRRPSINYEIVKSKDVENEYDLINKSNGEIAAKGRLEWIKERKKDWESKNVEGEVAAPFVTDTNAWTKLGLKVALKEAVSQGVDKIAWTTGEQQNDRYDLSKQVDEIGWQKNENGTYNITPKKDGSVVGTRNMMANLTLKQVEDYVGKDIAEKIQNDEGKVWEGGNVKQGKLTGQQLKIGGKGMKGFYGSPTEGSLGIVGQVAKSLFKQEPKTVNIEIGIPKIKDLAEALSTPFKKEISQETTPQHSIQHSIDITPEIKAEVQKGLPMFQFNNEKKVIDKINQLIEEGFTKERALDIVKSTKSFKKAVASGQISEQQITDEILGTGEKKEAATKKKIVEGEGGISKEAKEELSKRGVEYIEKQQSVSQKEANDIIASFEGRESDLEAHILNKSNAILDDVRVAIVQALIMKYSKDANIAESEGDINKRNKITIRQVDLIENLSEMVRENARALSIMNDKVWKAFINSNPQAVAASYRRKLDKRNELSLKEHKGTIKTFIDAIKNFKEEFENAITEAMVERGYAKEERVKKTRNIFKDIEFQYGADGKLTPQRGSSKYGIPDEIKGAAKEYAIQQVSSNNKNAVENTIAYINKEIEKLYNEGKIFSKSWDEAQFRADKKTEFSKNSEKDLEKWLQKKIDKIESLDENQKRVFLGDIFNELYSNGQVSDERVKELFGKAIGLPYANQETLNDLMKLQESIVEADKALEEYLKIKNPTYKDALKFKKIAYKAQQANNAKARLFQKADPEWKTFWDLMTAALQGGLLTVKSLVTNVNAYLYNNPLRAIARSFFGGGIEYLVSKAAKIILRNKVSDKYDYWTKPELLQGYWKGVGEYWTQKAEGLVEGIVDLWYGTSPDDYKDMPQFGGLRPALGWADAGKEFVNGLKSMSNKEWKQAVRHSGKVINGLAEGIIGVVPESMFRGLGVGDKPFRRAAMASRGVEIYVMSDVKAKHGVTFRQFMADPDRFVEGAKQDMIDYATTYTYQNKNIIYSLMTSASGTLTAAIDKNVTNKNIEAFINTIAPVLKFAAKTQTPYINTPLNVGWELLKWTNPMLSISIGISQVAFGEKNNSMFNKKDGYTNIGIGITGYIMLTMIAKMAELGMMSGGDDEDKKERQRGYEYIEGGKFNHSAFMRWVSGGSPKEQSGDKWWGVEKLGNVGMAFIVKHKMEEEKKDKEKKGEEFSESASALRSTIQTVLNSTFLTGVNRVVEGFLKGEREMNQWILGTAEAASTPFAPNLFMSIGKANDEYLRETKDTTLSNQLKNKLKQKWFSGSDLPPKISIWGEPIKARPEDWKDDQYLYEFFNIVKSKGYEPNQYGVELYKLSLRTDDLGALPSPASREIGGKKLSPEEYYRYAMLKGKLSRMYADDYINSINWKEDSDEQKIKELENIYSKATEDASKAMKGKLGLDEKIEEGLKSNYNLPKGVRQEMLDNISKTIFNTNWKK